MLVHHVSLLLLAALMILLPEVHAWGHRDDPELPRDPRIMKQQRADRLKDKLKQRGDLEWNEWHEARAYYDYQSQVLAFWPFLREAHVTWEQLMPNVTRMTAPRYDYYVRSQQTGEFRGRGTTWVLCIGPSWHNATKYVGYQMQVALEKLEDRGRAGKYKFAYVEGRFDELLKNTFDNRQNPSLWVIDGENGTAHHWDTAAFPDNRTIISWLEDRTYLNASFQFPVPTLITQEQQYLVYVVQFLRSNIGQRFEGWVLRVPGAPYIFQMFVNYEGDDPLFFKRDLLTAYLTPVILIFIILPLIWKTIKLIFRVTLECCWKEVEIEVEADDPRLLAQNEEDERLKKEL